MSRKPSKNRDPLAPIELVTTVLVALMCLTIVAAGPFVAFGSASIFGIGDRDACVDSTANGLQISGTGPKIAHLVDGAYGSSPSYSICSQSHAVALRLPYVTSQLTGFLFAIAAFSLLVLVLRAARRRGVFDRVVARRLRLLGWFLLAGAWLFPLIRAIAEARMLALLAPHAGDNWMSFYSPNFVVFVVGLGGVSMARVLDHTVPMRRELEATV